MGATASPATAAARLAQATVEGALREAPPAEGTAAAAAATQDIYMFARHRLVVAAAAPEEDDLPLLFDTRPSSGVHNSLCLVAMVLLLLWLVHLLLRLFTLRKITHQLRLQETPVVLRGLSCYADDLQRLARTHFEKVVRSHMPAAPIAVLRVRVAVQVKAVRAAPAAAARGAGNALESLSRGRRFKSPAEAAGAAAAARARAAAAAEQRAAAGDSGSRPASQPPEAHEDPQELRVEQQQGRVGSEDRGGGDQRQEKQLLPQQEGNERQLLLGRGQRSSRELRVMPEENEKREVAAAARNNRAAAAAQAAAAALGGGVGAAEDLELLVDADEVTHIFVYWGVDVRALQRLLDRKEEEPQAAARGFLQEPLRRLPRSMRQLFGRRFRSGGGAPATQSDVSRSLLELEHLEGTDSPSPSAAAAEGRRRGESNAPIVSHEERLAPSEYRLRSKLVVIPAGLNQKVLVSPRDPGCVLGSFREAAAAGDRRRGGGAATAAGDSPLEAPLVIISTGVLPAHQLLREVAHLSSAPLYEADTHVLVLRLAQPAAAHGWLGAAAPAAAAAAPRDEAAATAEEARGRESAAAAAADGRASTAAAGATGAVEGQPVAAEIWKEIVMGGSLGRAQERLDVYGLDDGSSSSSSPPFSDKECLVCMSNPKDVMLYPCRHCSLCSDCLRSLHQERCPICRSSFSAFLTFPLRRMHSYYPPSSSSSSSSSAAPAATAAAAGDGAATSSFSASTPSSAAPASPPGGSTAVSLVVDAPASETDSAAAAAGPAPAAGAALLGVAAAGAAAAATALDGGAAAEATPSAAAADAAAADDAGALQPRSRLSPAAGATPLGGLLSQMRHYVHYDELGSDEASDSSR